MIVDLSEFKTGICDKLRQVTFCATIATQIGDTLLEVYEIPTDECPFLITDLFEIDGFALNSLDIAPTNSLRMTPQNSIIEICTVITHKPHSLNVKNEVFLNNWRKTYTKLKPKHGITNIKLDEIKHDIVGIHIRLTDRISRWPSQGSITKFQYERFVTKKIPWIIKMANENNFFVFLASDNLVADQEVRSKLRPHVRLIESSKEWVKSGRRQTDGITFVEDLFWLSKSKYIYSTTGGGVPLTASLIGDINSSVQIWTEEKLFFRSLVFLRRVAAWFKILIYRFIFKSNNI
jgi:hypothetical protein